MPVVVGTSGWQYRDWRGLLYPPDLPQRDWLAYYASQYATVENNSTFYRLPARDTFTDWQARTPDDFVMAIKARQASDTSHKEGRSLKSPAPIGGAPLFAIFLRCRAAIC